VTLVDTSAWVEFLRDTGSLVCDEVDRLLGWRCAVTDPVVMEVLAGARDDRHLRDLRGLLARAELLRCESVDYETAASLYRACRKRGATVRRLVDCLIAAVAIRHDAPILHADADFDVLTQYTELEVARIRRR
jgi:predicted nucleic acid-binding protein